MIGQTPMPKLSLQQIRDLARSIITYKPGGIRYSALVAQISAQTPETPRNTIEHAVWNLDALFPNEIVKPSGGLFTPVSAQGNDNVNTGSTEQIAATGVKVKESDFYEPFAQWLKNDLDDACQQPDQVSD